jgi:ABC-type Fe3+/spermidine/putrescine transport system ATPase subunit
LFEHLSVEENVRFALRRKSESSDTKVAEISYALEVEGLFSKAPGRLSQAEKVRTAVARAMAAEPHVILLDDVLRELDPRTAAQTGRLIKQAQHRSGVTILHMMRDFTEALQLGGRVAVLTDGQIAQEGSPGEIHAHPANQQVEQIVAGWGATDAGKSLDLSL